MKLAALFSDNMVLQQQREIPVWGWAEPGTKVAVAIAGNSAAGVAGEDGKWMVRLPALPVGGPLQMSIQGGNETIVLRNVMVGEVWLCSGQSNMEWPLSASRDAKQEIAAADYPTLRLITIPRQAYAEPQKDVTARWEACTPGTVPSFSAVAYFFGRHLMKNLNVPVGLINASWGGTMVEPWTSKEALMAVPELRPATEPLGPEAIEAYEQALKQFEPELVRWKKDHLPKDPGNAGIGKGWADPAFAAADWATMQLPAIWPQTGLKFHGVIWFRHEVEIPAAWAGKDLTLSLGCICDCDTTYFNNTIVGTTGLEEHWESWMLPRIYRIPGRLVKPGKTVVTIRVYNHSGIGGFKGEAAQMSLAPDDGPKAAPLNLSGPWKYKVEHNFGLVQSPPSAPANPRNASTPCGQYNGLIAPLIPFALRGAIWYQGESNVFNAYVYRKAFPAMIADWRNRWQQGAFPFLFVQLANFCPVDPEPVESPWAELREAQLLALSAPNTGMAVAIDIGKADDIHPTNKQDVGLRLALNAMATVYGKKDIVYSGPIYRAAKVEGAKVRLTFDHVGSGLVAKGGEGLKGFAIAGEDRKFVWAEATIDGNAVVVWSDKVSNPAAVRYAWANNPVCNLYNRADLPASPFRTDSWPVSTQPKK